jgi:hypothetical protein
MSNQERISSDVATICAQFGWVFAWGRTNDEVLTLLHDFDFRYTARIRSIHYLINWVHSHVRPPFSIHIAPSQNLVPFLILLVPLKWCCPHHGLQ